MKLPGKLNGKWGLLAAALVVFGGLLVYVFWDLPSLDSLSENLYQPSVRILDRRGRPIYELIPPEGGRHAVLSADNLPQCIKDATIAVEDKHFYQNLGVDPQGILRSLWIDLQGGEVIAGGSTITQQVARNLLLSQDERFERSLRRKLREAWLASRLTQRFSKNEILAFYLNQMNYGGLTYGVEAASQTYFGKPASDLLLPECALLAGLPQAPGLYNPYTNPDLAKERQLVVLGLMEDQGYISHNERLVSESAPLSYNPSPYPVEAPHFAWLVRDQLDSLFADGTLDPSTSLVVRTTLDLDAQRLAQSAIDRQIAAFKPKPGELSHNVNNAALVALDPHTGEVLALVGSADYFDASIDGAVDMATSPRQTGSAFKPFVYALALDPNRPNPWTAATIIWDIPTTFTTHDGAPYTPVNYDGHEHGPVPVRQALASSLNVPAVLTLQHVGIPDAIHLAGQVGITSLGDPQEYDLSLVLGGGQISLLELSTAYATFANQGVYTGNVIILDIHDADGNLLYTPKRQPPQQVFDPRLAWLISDILSDDEARSLGFGANSTLKLDRTAAVKTGTTTNFHDNWTIGYTPDLLVGVWVGNSNHEAMHDVTGLTGAAPIWHETMRALLQGRPDKPFQRPDGLTQVDVCALSGLLPTPACAQTRQEWFFPGTEPTSPDTFYRQLWIDPRTGLAADDSVPADQLESKIVLDLPAAAIPWARARGLPLLVDYSFDANPDAADVDALVLLSPHINETYRFDPQFDQSAQQLLVEAAAGAGILQVSLWADGRPLETLSGGTYQAWWKLSVGEHRFWAQGVDLSGETVKSNVVTIQVVTD